MQVSLEECLHGLSNRLSVPAVENIDSHLVKAHERPHAHTAGDEHVHAVLGQVIYRGHASALLMRDIWQDRDVLNLSVGNLNERIEIAVPEMSAKKRIKPSGTA